MPSKAAKTLQYSFLSLAITDFNIRTNVMISLRARDNKYSPPDTKVYHQSSSIELSCRNIDPDDPPTDIYQFSQYGSVDDQVNPELTLADCHVCDAQGFKKYRKIRGIDIAV
ncbi:MAG: hypothetical protein WD071_10765 [Pseudohongiella sp.]|uniref:hypothetical protein n=1 Tax=Pseudohongiella sp. TaxID=1979412 RepID=UPI0034A094F7